MRNLRLYETEAAFQAYEVSLSGDGNTTQTIVPGVSMSKNPRKRFFNPHDKTVHIHTLTINYKDMSGNTVAQSETMRFKYISGITQEIVLTPKDIFACTPTEASKKVMIPQTNSVDFTYDKDFEKLPLTINVISAGVIYLSSLINRAEPHPTIQYSKNFENWVTVTSASSIQAFQVYSGDVIQLRGDNVRFATGTNTNKYNNFSASTSARYVVEGNIMSLLSSSDFTEVTKIPVDYAFARFFSDCTGLISATNLVLPAETLQIYCYAYMFYGCSRLDGAPQLPAVTLTNGCYYAMFQGCTSLTAGPELPAPILVDSCYYRMFDGCTKLNSIKCLATNNSATNCTAWWLNNVASSGTFYQYSNIWTGNSVSGIPPGWTRVNATL